MGPATYYIEGLFRQANAAYAREYLGITDANGAIIQDPPLWNDVRIPMASMRPGAASATAQPWLGGIRAYRFRQGTGDDLEFELQLPHGFNEDAAYGIRLHVHWYSAAATTPNTVHWNVEVAATSVGLQYPAATNTYGNWGETTLARQHVLTSLHTFAGLHESAVIVGRIYRSGIHDTYAGDVFGLSLDAHCPIKSFGSFDEMGD
jgi:hypothetical protein